MLINNIITVVSKDSDTPRDFVTIDKEVKTSCVKQPINTG
jgi:hypothetical protein